VITLCNAGAAGMPRNGHITADELTLCLVFVIRLLTNP